MGKFFLNITMSLDGYVAGPEQSVKNPLGIGGEALHDWLTSLGAWREAHGHEGGELNASTPLVEEMRADVGAVIMGRNMFGGQPGPWAKEPWTGWWGDNPPFHTPVYVITHHRREPLALQGGTTFHFVADGIETALKEARRAAGDKHVLLGGGASVAQQYLAAGLLEELNVSVVPLVLGAGARLLDNLGRARPQLEQVRVIDAPGVTHLRYRVRK